MLRVLLLVLALTTGLAARAHDAPPPAPAVVMYSTDWCGYCAKARAYFAENGIAYVDHDIDTSAAAGAAFRRHGGRVVPLIFVGSQRLDGFSELAFEFARLKAAR